MIVQSWNEHLLQKERMTKVEKDLLQKAWSLHMGSVQPEERIYLSVNRELLTPRQCDCQPPTAPKSQVDFTVSRARPPRQPVLLPARP